jgi:serine/threonine-protein kinase
MSLNPGTRLGSYEIVSAIGAGGMGEVYRATDTNLGRQVAIKVLPDAFAQDPERVARFEREAKTLASLNHPNIAIIHGLEKSQGTYALVMELVEGEDLSQRIARGPIPLDEALPIAKQIAEALEAAHEQGIIHRDLKPANIKLRLDGTVKVLDFGLAKALDRGSSAIDAAQSPTLTSPALMTGVGVLLGTAAYMSPEQARGKAVDKRSDIWSYGCVLYEMLTACRAFQGDEVSITLAAVMMKEPHWNRVPATVPSGVRRLLRSCLEKDSKHRLQAIGDARVEIERVLRGVPEDAITPAMPSSVPLWRGALPWAALASVFGLALLAVLIVWPPWRTAASAPPVRLEAAVGADASIVNFQASLAVSPDGALLAVAAQGSQGVPELYVRRLGDLRATPLAGTAGARDPFFSPDGKWIGFFAGGRLKKIAVMGGAPVTLADAPDDRGGTWAEDGSIVFQSAGLSTGLMRVSSAGGTPARLTTLRTGEAVHRWPQVLPGGTAVLYTAHSSVTGLDDATIVIQPLPSGEPKVVLRGGYYGRYLQSGHLVYVLHGTLFAASFDLARLELTGQPVPVIEDIAAYPGGSAGGLAGSAQFASTNSGTAVYLAGESLVNEAPLQWMDHTGNVTALRAAPANWTSPRVSPDGRRIAIDMLTAQPDVFVYEWARDTLTRLTFDPNSDLKPVWTPDSQRIVFRSNRDKDLNLYWLRADGSGDVQRLTESQNIQTPVSWHPSGKFLAFYEGSPQTANDLMILPMGGEEASGWKPGKPTVFLRTPFSELEPVFSPDGQWIAYQSNESGRFEVYVRPFPGPGGKWQISTEGGWAPTWSRTRSEIFYASPDNRLMVAPYRIERDAFTADRPRVWSERRFMLRPGLGSFDLHPDGERFALAAAPENDRAIRQDKLVFVFNFFDELRRLAPVVK